MSGNATSAGYRLRAEELSKKALKLQVTRDNLLSQQAKLSQEIAALGEEIILYSKVGELFRSLLDRMVLDHVRSIESVVTEGLRAIFVNQDIRFIAEISQRYGKVAIDFLIQQRDGGRVVKAPPLEGFGGGCTNVASLILKVLVMKRLQKWPLLILDESLNGVSDDYIEATGLLMRDLAEKMGMSFLLVTHKAQFSEHAHTKYHASEKIDGQSRELHLTNRS